MYDMEWWKGQDEKTIRSNLYQVKTCGATRKPKFPGPDWNGLKLVWDRDMFFENVFSSGQGLRFWSGLRQVIFFRGIFFFFFFSENFRKKVELNGNQGVKICGIGSWVYCLNVAAECYTNNECYECNGTNIFIRWKMKTRRSWVEWNISSFNEWKYLFHCTNAKHPLFVYITAK